MAQGQRQQALQNFQHTNMRTSERIPRVHRGCLKRQSVCVYTTVGDTQTFGW